jgi:tellurium resistance protein TerD
MEIFMSISLIKGDRINLSKELPNLNKIGVGLGWEANHTDTGHAFDLDASVFLLGANGKIANEKNFVFYNNLISPDGAVKHTGDNRSGDAQGDDETIYVELNRLDSSIQEVVFVVTIHEAELRRQNFGQVRNAYIRLYDLDSKNQVLKYELDENFSRETAIEFAKFYRRDNEWRFQALGQGFNSGLQGFVNQYYAG